MPPKRHLQQRRLIVLLSPARGPVRGFHLSNDPPSIPEPSYEITPLLTSVNESSVVVTFTITTANVANGTVLYWQNVGTTSTGDFIEGLQSGTVIVQNNSATVVFTTVPDLTTEGTETLRVQLHEGSLEGTLLATSSTVTITDNSITLEPSYAFSLAENTTAEAGGETSYTFTVNTTNVANGTTLYWDIKPDIVSSVSASDLTTGSSGSFTIQNNTGSIIITFVDDYTKEGPEYLQLRLRTGSVSGSVVASSGVVTIPDSSKPPSFTQWISPLSIQSTSTDTRLITNILNYNTDGTVAWGATQSPYQIGFVAACVGPSMGVYALMLARITTLYSSDGTAFKTLPNPGGNILNVIRYNKEGIIQWHARSSFCTNALAIASDAQGNVYVSGMDRSNRSFPVYNASDQLTLTIPLTDATLTGTDRAFVIKFNSSGTPLWAATMDGLGTPTSETPRGLQVDSTGNVYVGIEYLVNASFAVLPNPVLSIYDSTGSVVRQLPAGQYASGVNQYRGAVGIMKFDTNGIFQWATYMKDMGASIGATITGFKLHEATNTLYIAGIGGTRLGAFTAGDDSTPTIEAASTNSYLVKYNTNTGAPSWIATVSISPRDIDVDASGNVYFLTGRTGSTSPSVYRNAGATTGVTPTFTTGGNANYNMICGLGKYDTNGSLQWTTTWSGTNPTIAIDKTTGDIFVSSEMTTASTSALPTRIFSSNGTLSKSYTNNGTATTNNYEGTLIKYNSSGIYQFSRRLYSLNEAQNAEVTTLTNESIALQFVRGTSVYGVGRFLNTNATTTLKTFPIASGTEPPSL